MKNTIARGSAAIVRRSGHLRLGVIGLGLRISHVLSTLFSLDADAKLAMVADPATESVREKIASRGYPGSDSTTIVSDAEQLLACADQLDAIFIGTRCNLHAPLAAQAAVTRLPLFLEKPVATSWSQLSELAAAFEGNTANVVISFPLRCTDHVSKAVEIIRSGRLGTVNQIVGQNFVPYGGVYFAQWYRDARVTGGLWLAKTTHDFDYINYLLGATPVAVTAMHTRLAYGGDRPWDLTCLKCDRYDSCPESPRQLTARRDDGGMLMGLPLAPDTDHLCAFSKDILNQDAGSALVMYHNGAHASYTQNFIPRQLAGFRGSTVIGYDATLSIDFRAAKIRVTDHHRAHMEEIGVKTGPNHFGGDEVLIQNFLDVIRQRKDSIAPLRTGLISAAMCLAARDAAASGQTKKLPDLPGLTMPTMPTHAIEPPDLST